MKKSIKYILMLLVVTLLLGGCNKQTPTPADDGKKDDNKVTTFISTEGLGEVAATDDGSEPKFDDAYPFTQFIFNTDPGTEIKMETRSTDKSWVFVKWTKDGEFVSDETKLSVKADETAEYVARFSMSTGYEGTPVTKIEDAKTLADVLALPFSQSGYTDKKYIFVFELNNVIYRAVAELDDATLEQLNAIDILEEGHQQKENAIVAPLAITRIDNVSEHMPTAEKLKSYEGKTGAELLEEGWTITGINVDDLQLDMDHAQFRYQVYFEGNLTEAGSFNEDKDMKNLKVTKVVCYGIGDLFDLDAAWE